MKNLSQIASVCALTLALTAPALCETTAPNQTSATLSSASAGSLKAPQMAVKPRLTVLMVIDQLRDEQINKFRPYFLPSRDKDGQIGGFNYLIENGSQHRVCRFDTQPCHTGAGHGVISTGGSPYTTGVLGNKWYDRTLQKTVAVTGNDNYPIVGNPTEKAKGGVAPDKILASTIGDELKLATNGLGLVYSLSIKERAAVILGGHSADAVFWYDYSTGNWVSSKWYLPEGELPQYINELNQEKWLDQQYGWTWNRLLPEEAYRLCAPDGHRGACDYTFGTKLESKSGKPDKWYRSMATTSPLGDTLTLISACKVLDNTELGRDDVPDLLTLNLCSHDRIGHSFGPNSPQIEDEMVSLDRDLAKFLRHIDESVGLENTAFVITGDHGCAPTTEYAQDFKLDAGRMLYKDVEDTAQKALEAQFGPGKYVLDFSSHNLYLNDSLIPAGKLTEARELAREAICQCQGIFQVFTRDEILKGQMPRTAMSDVVSRSYHRGRSGDLFVLLRPFWRFESRMDAKGAAHGLPWCYDTQIPLLIYGPGVKAGQRFQNCRPQDISATLCNLMQVTLPTACEGRVLEEDF